MFCDQCGATIDPGAKFCEECGSKVDDDTTSFPLPVTSPQFPQFSHTKGSIVVILVALVLGGGLWLAFRPTKIELVDVARVLPENTAVLISFRNPVTYWEGIEKSNFYQTVRTTAAWRELTNQLQKDEGFQTFQTSLDQLGVDKTILKHAGDLISLGIIIDPANSHEEPAPLLILQGTAALQLAERAGVLKKLIEDRGYTVRVEQTGGMTLYSVRLGTEELYYVFAGNFVLAGPRGDLIRDAVARLQNKRKATLADTAGFAGAFGVQSEPRSMSVYLNGPALLRFVTKKTKGNEAWQAFLNEAPPIQALAFSISFDQGLVVRSRVLVDQTKMREKGLPLSLHHSITNASLALLPAETLGYHLMSGAYFTDYLPQTYGKEIDKVSAELGADLRQELLSQVGHEVTFAFLEPDPDLPLPLPGLVLTLEAGRGEESFRAFEAVIARVTDQLRRSGHIGMPEATDYRGIRIVFYRSVGGISLVYARVGNFLVVGTGANVVKKVVDVAKGGGADLLHVFQQDSRLREYIEEKNSEMVHYLNFQALLDALIHLANRPEVSGFMGQDRAQVEKAFTLIEPLRVLQYLVARSWTENGVGEGIGYAAMKDLTTRGPEVQLFKKEVKANPPPMSQAAVSHFTGYWANEDPNTGGITHVEIRFDTGAIFVHMWGKCYPTDCDWGETKIGASDATDKVLSITWTFSFMMENQQLTALSDGRLRVTGHTHFTDNSGRTDYDATYYFVRSDNKQLHR